MTEHMTGRLSLIWIVLSCIALWLLPAPAAAAPQSGERSHSDVVATRTNRPPVIDGHLTDECWALAVASSDFTQQDPDEGKPATEHTEVRFVYDDEALYVGIRLFDSSPAGIVRRLSTRDSDPDADRVTLYIDSMHDHLTGAVFRVSAANVQQDSILFNDSWTDSTWDAVWQSQVAVDDQGWSVEMRIPLSQLRFPSAEHQTWGVNVERFIQRKNERSWLEMVPKNQSGIASRMLNLTGLDGVHPTRHLELLPYAAARNEMIAPAAGNPFNDGSRAFASAGLDMKWGVTSNLTLNATVNPDFGQVEVDPAVVNLTAFETFFPEKRAFFLEGSQIFNNFGQGGSNSFWGFNSSDPDVFYSRRIGRAPQLTPSGDFIDSPTATTILGATKLTGKTRRGWSVGLLEAVTGREEARVLTSGVSSNTAVEPLTNYAVARMQREFAGRVGLGFITTAVNRQLDTPALQSSLTRSAYVFGTDAYVFLDHKRDWVLTGKMSGSRIDGTTDAIATEQNASQRYFQRPDAAQVHFDPTRTSLSGYAARINLNRNSGNWQVNSALWGVSPGYESNDLGFHVVGDRAGAHTVLYWRDVQPDATTRSKYFWVAKWWVWNYARELQGNGVNFNSGVTFRNYWNLNFGGGYFPRVLDDRLTRGGPSATNPSSRSLGINGGTDSRQVVSANASYNHNWNEEGGWAHNVQLSVKLKPSPRFTITAGPQWSQSRNVAQYVSTVTDPYETTTYGSRYIFGSLDQTQVSMTTRVAVVLSPTVSLQVFAQPLLAAGDYTHVKQLATPRTFDFLDYAAAGLPISYDGVTREYTIDADADGPASPFVVSDPNFNLRSLRLNAVFRWEMKPGSTLYGVWTRQQQDSTDPAGFSFGRDAHAMFAAPGDDVFLVKIAYWIGR
jgi:hypothetical protein